LVTFLGNKKTTDWVDVCAAEPGRGAAMSYSAYRVRWCTLGTSYIMATLGLPYREGPTFKNVPQSNCGTCLFL